MTGWLSFEQILGYVASAILLSGYAIKSDVKTKIVLIFSYLVFALHFFMLGAFTACAISIVSIMRNSSSIFFHQSKIIFSIFVTFYISSAFFTYGAPVDILPLLAALVTCFGMFLLRGIRFRILVVVATVLWTIHNVMVGSIGGTINTVILFFIASVTVWRLYKDGKKVDVNE